MEDLIEDNKKTFIAAGGCFWGIQKYYSLVNGVLSATAGYIGGNTESPTYKEIKTGSTNHAEAVLVEYDSTKTDLKKLLDHYFFITDPTTLNRQKNDKGTQYRSILYYNDKKEKELIEEYINAIQDSYKNQIVTEINEMTDFWPAEKYHQYYLDKNPRGYCHLTSYHFKYVEEIDKGY